MRTIDPSDLNVFLAIARRGSFRAAAIDLRVTPSALSHALRSLEERIDVRLFNRTTRSVSLTEAGQRLYDRAAPAFRDIEDAIDDLAEFRGMPMGTLRINAAEASARMVLMPLVAAFLEANPAVSIDIVSQGALIDIVSGGYDAGVRFGETIAADMIAVPIGPRQRFAVVATPQFLTRWPKPMTPHDLMKVPCVRYRFDNGALFDWEFERGAIELNLAVEGRFSSNSTQLMIEAALAGVGIGYIFEGLIAAQLDDGRLVRMLEDWCPYFPGLHLYYPSRRQMPTALRAFIDFARNRPA
jgi:DNA-binding transcriptional LysR family regulator